MAKPVKSKPLQALPDIPPKWVLLAADANLRGGCWENYYEVLCGYYGIPPIRATVNYMLDATKLEAHFVGSEPPRIESPQLSMGKRTALHEFFHYLIFVIRGKNGGEGEQALADAFARACMEKDLWSTTENGV